MEIFTKTTNDFHTLTIFQKSPSQMFDRLLSRPLDCTYDTVKIRSSHKRRSVKNVLLESSQNSRESTCARVSFLIKLQGMKHRCFPVNFALRKPFLQNTSGLQQKTVFDSGLFQSDLFVLKSEVFINQNHGRILLAGTRQLSISTWYLWNIALNLNIFCIFQIIVQFQSFYQQLQLTPEHTTSVLFEACFLWSIFPVSA